MNIRKIGFVRSAEVVLSPTIEYGVRTEWAIALHFHSPTGDSSDFMVRELPCLSREQAVVIADRWNSEVCPELVGRFAVSDLVN
jgi:hypothetical protein